MNKYLGEVVLNIGGKEARLVYDWRALSEIQTKHGASILKDLFKGVSPDTIADILAIGFRKHNPEVTAAAILDASPPFVPMVQAIDKALSFSYFGADGIPDEVAAEVDEDAKKKTE